jgi:hypothetical protein
MEWVVLFTEVAEWIRYIGEYGGYGLSFVLIFLSAYLLPVFKVKTGYNGTFGSGLGLSFIYVLYAAANIFVHEFFAPELQLWSLYFKKVVAEREGALPHDEGKEIKDLKNGKESDDKVEEGSNWNGSDEADSFEFEFGQWNKKADHDLWENETGMMF